MDMSTSVTHQENGQSKGLPGTTQTQSPAFHSGLIDRLFARFAAMYGTRFIDMWRDIEIDDVKKCWADELRIFSVEQIGMAVGNLKANNFPPTLPEFLQLCGSARQQRPRVAQHIALPKPDKSESQGQEWEEAKARFMALTSKCGARKPSNDWAHTILRRFEAGENVGQESLRIAREAMQ